MIIYVVYDTWDKELPVYYGNIHEIADYFNTSIYVIRCCVTRKTLRENRYLIEKVIIDDED